MLKNNKMTKAQIKKSKIYSPGLIGGEVVHFLSASKGLFFLNHDGHDGYVKDDKGIYSKLTLNEVIDARFTYLSSFLEKEMKDAIEEEMGIIGMKYVKMAEELIYKIERYEERMNDSYEKDSFNIHSLIFQLQPDPGKAKQEYKQKAVDFFNENPYALTLKNKIKLFVEKKDYESLYKHFISFGDAMGSFRISEESDLTAFINIFGAKNIDKTLDEMKEKGSLFLIAKINVEKKYYPE